MALLCFLLNLFITNAIIADANAPRMILPTSSEEPLKNAVSWSNVFKVNSLKVGGCEIMIGKIVLVSRNSEGTDTLIKEDETISSRIFGNDWFARIGNKWIPAVSLSKAFT